MYDNTINGSLKVILKNLTAEDTGKYWFAESPGCEVDGHTAVNLRVTEGQAEEESPHQVSAYVGHDAKIKCHYEEVDRDKSKYLCKNEDVGCKRKIRTGLKDQWWYNGRYSLYDNTNRRHFLVSIANVTREDAGIYWCAVDELFHDDAPVAVDKFEVVRLEVRTGPAAGSALALPVCLSLFLLIAAATAGAAAFICIRGKKKKKSVELNFTQEDTTFGNTRTKTYTDNDNQEKKNTNMSSSSSEVHTIHSETNLPTNPCSMPLAATPSVEVTADCPLQVPGPNYASVRFQKSPHSSHTDLATNNDDDGGTKCTYAAVKCT
ncbi:polymeric immunoglobulin receptor-like [Engraulis encrasicolus]|uniref:polymeric immunoglobulin receptor-like n=1 Tax=Engraulis encrasicolus TaxID=184585 RepID=UPI002FCF113B